MTGLRITTMLSLLVTLGPVSAGPTVTAEAKTRPPAAADVVTAEADLDFLEFLGGADDAPPDPDAPYDEPVTPSGRAAPAPAEKAKVTP